jgi:thioredoxin 1
MTDQLLSQVQCPCGGGRSSPLLLLALIAGTWLVIGLLKAVFGKKGADSMSKSKKIAIVVVLIVAVVAVFAAKQDRSRAEPATPQTNADTVQHHVAAHSSEQSAEQGRPTLIDLGAGTCIPCKMMAPILEDLKAEYAGTMDVRFLDVHKDPELISRYNIRVIPTQIFYDAAGKELFRHEGFFAKEDVLAKWQELGVDLVSQP